ncbi:hypothetical protein ACIQTZ_23995, partial [Paenarthrobacter sp. NPDC090520]|uniref:hypothetical protein n=1 Tax=Paenarthrobacter sp. NPDC090520 TaxID=3364382 RepID=UPI003802E61D
VHPEPGSNSPFKNKKRNTTTPTGNHGKKQLQNSKPAENQTTTHGGARRSSKNQPINKTIGINKLGTLLSSQTTDPSKHHPNSTPPKAAQPSTGHWKRRIIIGRQPNRTHLPAFRFAPGDSENNTRPQPPTQIHPQATPRPARGHT